MRTIPTKETIISNKHYTIMKHLKLFLTSIFIYFWGAINVFAAGNFTALSAEGKIIEYSTESNSVIVAASSEINQAIEGALTIPDVVEYNGYEYPVTKIGTVVRPKAYLQVFSTKTACSSENVCNFAGEINVKLRLRHVPNKNQKINNPSSSPADYRGQKKSYKPYETYSFPPRCRNGQPLWRP